MRLWVSGRSLREPARISDEWYAVIMMCCEVITEMRQVGAGSWSTWKPRVLLKRVGVNRYTILWRVTLHIKYLHPITAYYFTVLNTAYCPYLQTIKIAILTFENYKAICTFNSDYKARLLSCDET